MSAELDDDSVEAISRIAIKIRESKGRLSGFDFAVDFRSWRLGGEEDLNDSFIGEERRAARPKRWAPAGREEPDVRPALHVTVRSADVADADHV